MSQNIKIKYYIATIIILSFILRIVGISYGLPLILNIDEPSLVSTTLSLPRTWLIPGRFDWPHLHFYINLFIYSVFYVIRQLVELVGLKDTLHTYLPIVWQSPGIFIFISRFINVLLGSLTVIPLFLYAKNILKDCKLALFSVLLLAVLPVHIMDSQRALLDTAMTFWVTWFLYYSSLLSFKSEKKLFLITGLFLGLAFSTKYTAILYLIYYFIYFIILSGVDFSRSIKSSLESINLSLKLFFSKGFLLRNIYMFLGFILTYAATNFSIFVNPELFWSTTYGRGFLFLFKNVGEKTGIEYPFALIENLYTQSLTDYGFSLYVFLAMVFCAFMFFGYRKKKVILTFLFPLIFYFYISGKDRSPSHYFILLYPLLSAMVVYVLSDFSKFLSQKIKFKSKSSIVFVFLFVLVVSSPLFKSLNQFKNIYNGDTRLDFYNWVINNSISIPIYYYGEELQLVSFKNNINYNRIKLIDYEFIKQESPYFYLVFATSGKNTNEVLDFKGDLLEISGDERDVLKNSSIEKSFTNKNKLGPSIYVFKVKNE